MHLEDMMKFNREFVDKKEYEKYQADKYPAKKTAILTCMDTRLTELLPAALGIRNGDVKLIKNAGGIISHPYGSVMHSLVIAVYELGVEEVWVIGHDDCGMQNVDCEALIGHMHQRGITDVDIARSDGATGGIEEWLRGFGDVNEAVLETARIIRNHPLMPRELRVFSLIMNPVTGEVRPAEETEQK